MKTEVTPSSNWSIGRRIILLDAYMRNPIDVKVTRHPNADHVIVEDDRGVVYFARTDRITGYSTSGKTREVEDFADILG
ncbi:hypothetical protein [Rhizobium nepotum]|uniref:hypothetical protein n=1 Tax=Rhizobium nepotum TaxID=1035271 RepID=UPI003CF3AFE3